MAQLIKATGPIGARAAEVHPRNGRAFTLPELQRYVGGYIEALRLLGGKIMWLNEDGKSLNLPRNTVATSLAHAFSGIAETDYIVGDVVIATLEESGEGEDEDECEGATA